ncbi:MAG TPA: hypothetical protein VNJ03_10565 [Vicinamibacterales bacterium]|nr:hypothetical protein [Vicinamibacterales bacterium]
MKLTACRWDVEVDDRWDRRPVLAIGAEGLTDDGHGTRRCDDGAQRAFLDDPDARHAGRDRGLTSLK